MEKFFKKIRYVKFKDIISIFYFLFALFPALVLKIFNNKKEVWLICEDKNEARDNGFSLFEYICNNKKDKVKCIYAINKKSPDYIKVAKLGMCIQYSSFLHYIWYLVADKNISSQKGGKPNAALFYFLEVYGILKNKRIFLQHGITLSNAEWLYYNNTKMRLFICGAKREYEYVKKNFGYPNGYVKHLGFPRFDKLNKMHINKKQILIMPSWREWLIIKTDAYYEFEKGKKIEETQYFLNWNALLNSEEVDNFLIENDLNIIFYPHRNMQPFLGSFITRSSRIKIVSWVDYDIQELLKESILMITDYSSVCMDFAYMKKPIIYYQFDYEQFRKGQYSAGYFNYNTDGFGKVVDNLDDLIINLNEYAKKDFVFEKKFDQKVDDFFGIRDNKNCSRIYETIKRI